MGFNANKVKDDIVVWIRKMFEENGKGCNAVIGISGGKDSSVTAALCVAALGKDRVIGVLMPNGKQEDKNVAVELCNHLGINHIEINVKNAFDSILEQIDEIYISKVDSYIPISISDQTTINLPPRLRMATLYAVSQSVGGRVMNTCNLSEDYVGYATRYGLLADYPIHSSIKLRQMGFAAKPMKITLALHIRFLISILGLVFVRIAR